MTIKTVTMLVLGLVAALAATTPAPAHDGKLDVFGCHYDSQRKAYHCHEGTFKGGTFESRTEMVRKLKAQFLDLGRPWPYDDIVEEDITSAQPQQQ